MPVLRQRRDGGYFIRRGDPDRGKATTWQVANSGLSTLREHGVEVDQWFSHQPLTGCVRFASCSQGLPARLETTVDGGGIMNQ